MRRLLFLVVFFPLSLFSQPSGNGMVFDGNSDYYTVNDNSSIDLSGSFTIEAWINPCDTSGHSMILAKQWCNGGQFSFYLSILDGKLKWAWNTIGSCGGTATRSYESNTRIIRNNSWQHVSIVHTPTSISLYHNTLLVPGSLLSGTYSGNLYNSNAPLRVGVYRGLSGAYSNYFNGRMDEIRMWNTALTTSQISTRYNTPLIGTETNLQLYHNFESISGLVINNSCVSSGAVNNGTNTIGLVRTRPNASEYPNSFFLGNDTILCDSTPFSLTIPLLYSGYLWSDGTTSNIKPISNSGVYIGKAYRDFCYSSDTISITLIDCDTTVIDTTSNPIDYCNQKFLMPNVFSPNADGNNDLFKPVYYDCYNLISLKIYNRWGQIVYESSSKIEWDGKTKNGRSVSDGTYYWIIHHKNKKGEEEYEKGYLKIFI